MFKKSMHSQHENRSRYQITVSGVKMPDSNNKHQGVKDWLQQTLGSITKGNCPNMFDTR